MATLTATESSTALRYFRCLDARVDIAPLLAEIDAQPEAWLVDTSRQSQLRVQRETNAIPLRIADPARSLGRRRWDVHATVSTPLAAQFPRIMGFLENLAQSRQADLCRVRLVRLPPGGQVYPHIDRGQYYKPRDRYHLVLRSAGSLMQAGDEQLRWRAGELWWFDNKQTHSAANDTGEDRLHLIFDLLPWARRDQQLPPAPPAWRAQSRHFALADLSLDLEPLLAELVGAGKHWRERGAGVSVITLRRVPASQRHLPRGEVLESRYARGIREALPVTVNFLKNQAVDWQSRLGRAWLVRLAPGAGLGPRRDRGAYHRVHDRLQLVLQSGEGNHFRCGEESRILRVGELWRIDQRVSHGALNRGLEDRLHLVFDLRRTL